MIKQSIRILLDMFLAYKSLKNQTLIIEVKNLD